ncbi:hypothetical protein [Corynebacterium sp. CCM 9204]|uniref:hypothetical protein n=1 Tax=Corynebacterium sp. CCM 9204 TaxID=3057616 RepID=UPI003525A1AC
MVPAQHRSPDIGGELAVDQVVVDGRSRTPVPAPPTSADGAGPSVVLTDPPHGPVTHRLAGGVSLVGEVAVAELRVLPVSVA